MGLMLNFNKNKKTAHFLKVINRVYTTMQSQLSLHYHVFKICHILVYARRSIVPVSVYSLIIKLIKNTFAFKTTQV